MIPSNRLFEQPCTTLLGVGPALAEKLSRCGMFTLSDVLFHFPLRYQDRTRITPIQDALAGEYCVIAGRITQCEVVKGKRPMLSCLVEDGTAMLRMRFFHFNAHQIKQLNECVKIRAFGEVRQFREQKEMIHPEYQLMKEDGEFTVDEHLTPIYPTTHGLSQSRIRQLVQQVLEQCRHELQLTEWMDENELALHGLMSYENAIPLLHQPPPDVAISALQKGLHPAWQRLVFDELLAHRVSMQLAKEKRLLLQAPAIVAKGALLARFLAQLPFKPTGAQVRVKQEIEADMAKHQPMLRLVQGDVGSGKTLNAAMAAIAAVEAGFQVALMAPTDILSEQHVKHLLAWLEPLGIKTSRLTGKMKASEKRQTLHDVQSGACQVVVGTHALFQEDVVFARLGLVIIDEQHRFGVEQRLKLTQKGPKNAQVPHQLLMTATPIPRTLAMTQLAHLDVSVIDEMPPGRTPVTTAVIHQSKRESVMARLQAAIAEGRQAYWVCTLVEESEKLQCMAATQTAETLTQHLHGVRIGLVHGRMKGPEKEAVMAAFKQKELDLLVATTVIEVGVDVSNASLMIIENAERLGLSQLHQLRGRVGRGAVQSHCILLYQTPLSAHGAERLKTMRATTDGFEIAEKDLQLRGAGEILGSRQAGYRAYQTVEFPRDTPWLPKVAQCAKALLLRDPLLAKTVSQRWLGHFEAYLQG